MEKTYAIEFTMAELEIVKRGLREMNGKYKRAYAEAHGEENELKQLERAMKARLLLETVKAKIEIAKAETEAEAEIELELDAE